MNSTNSTQLTNSSYRIGGKKDGTRVSFPCKLYEVLENAEEQGFNHIISWNKAGTGFTVHDKTKFIRDIIPRYMNCTKYKSFQRQLSLYGWERIATGADKGLRYHKRFQRGNFGSVVSMKPTAAPPKKQKKRKGTSSTQMRNATSEEEAKGKVPSVVPTKEDHVPVINEDQVPAVRDVKTTEPSNSLLPFEAKSSQHVSHYYHVVDQDQYTDEEGTDPELSRMLMEEEAKFFDSFSADFIENTDDLPSNGRVETNFVPVSPEATSFGLTEEDIALFGDISSLLITDFSKKISAPRFSRQAGPLTRPSLPTAKQAMKATDGNTVEDNLREAFLKGFEAAMALPSNSKPIFDSSTTSPDEFSIEPKKPSHFLFDDPRFESYH